jgi:transposase
LFDVLRDISRAHIRAVINPGATASAITEMLEVSPRAVNNGVARVRNGIDPSMVATGGASIRVRDTVLKKELWKHVASKTRSRNMTDCSDTGYGEVIPWRRGRFTGCLRL